MGKNKARKPLLGGSGGSRSVTYDKLLLPRLENYAQNNSYEDVDEVADFLRRTYKEYARKQMGPFRQQVARAVAQLQRKGGVSKPELQLQVGGELGQGPWQGLGARAEPPKITAHPAHGHFHAGSRLPRCPLTSQHDDEHEGSAS